MTSHGTWTRVGSNIVIELPAPARAIWRGELGGDVGVSGDARPTLLLGARGAIVASVQSRLREMGFDPGSIDGIFGRRTAAAVRALQATRHLAADGIVGPMTWGALYGRVEPPTSATGRSVPLPGTGERSLRVDVPFLGYRSNDKAGCFRRCSEMAAAVGVTVGGPDVRIQIATREDAMGHVSIDSLAARMGLAYLDSQLRAGRPVCVGVSYTDASYNVDDITDHFVLVTCRGSDARGMYYGFHDPASSRRDVGGDQNHANRFRGTPAGGLYRAPSASAPLASRTYDVSMVRRNA